LSDNLKSIQYRRGRAEYDFDAEFSAYGCDIYEICPHDTQDNSIVVSQKRNAFIILNDEFTTEIVWSWRQIKR
jgi:hypothetical protein